MPMPPPKPSTEGPRDRQVFHEMGQIVRAIDGMLTMGVGQFCTNPGLLIALDSPALCLFWSRCRFGA